MQYQHSVVCRHQHDGIVTRDGSAVGVRYRSMPLSFRLVVAQYSANICCISAREGAHVLGLTLAGYVADWRNPPLGAFWPLLAEAHFRQPASTAQAFNCSFRNAAMQIWRAADT